MEKFIRTGKTGYQLIEEAKQEGRQEGKQALIESLAASVGTEPENFNEWLKTAAILMGKEDVQRRKPGVGTMNLGPNTGRV